MICAISGVNRCLRLSPNHDDGVVPGTGVNVQPTLHHGRDDHAIIAVAGGHSQPVDVSRRINGHDIPATIDGCRVHVECHIFESREPDAVLVQSGDHVVFDVLDSGGITTHDVRVRHDDVQRLHPVDRHCLRQIQASVVLNLINIDGIRETTVCHHQAVDDWQADVRAQCLREGCLNQGGNAGITERHGCKRISLRLRKLAECLQSIQIGHPVLWREVHAILFEGCHRPQCAAGIHRDHRCNQCVAIIQPSQCNRFKDLFPVVADSEE